MPSDKDISKSRKKTVCICPKCCRPHKKAVYWTGRGKPKIFCDDCKRNIKV